MNITNLKRVLPLLIKHKIPPFIWGTQGIGKSQVVKQVANELGIGYVCLCLGTQSDMGDILGLLTHNYKVIDGIAVPDGTVRHARPEWMPTEGSGILFLDELNRAHPDVLQGMFTLLTEGRIHTHQLPPGWSVVAAGNYQNNNFTTTDMSDAAFLSRFCHLDFKPSVEEFILFAESIGAFNAASFAREQPSLLGDDLKQSLDFNMVKPDRRAWLDMVGRLEGEDLGDAEYDVLSGCVGSSAAAAYISHKKKVEKGVTINEVLTAYNKVKTKVKLLSTSDKTESARFDLLNTATAELMVKLDAKPDLLTDKKLDNLKEFLLDIPVELSMKVFDEMKNREFKGKESILNDIEFVKRFVDKSKGKAA